MHFLLRLDQQIGQHRMEIGLCNELDRGAEEDSMESSNKNGDFAFKMQHAREVYDEARGLLEADAEPRYVMNSL